MRPRLLVALGLCAVALLAPPAAAQAGFGLLAGSEGFDVRAVEEDGSPDLLSGSHPYELRETIGFALAGGGPRTEGDPRDLRLDLPPGLIENPRAVAQCSQARFDTPRRSPFEASASGEYCPGESQIGTVAVTTALGGGQTRTFGLFDLAPPPGAPAQIGFNPYGMPIVFTPEIRETGSEFGLTLRARDIPQQLDLQRLEITVWGTPWATIHNGERGDCLNEAEPAFPRAKCQVSAPRVERPLAYLTLPSSCEGPLAWRLTADAWQGGGESEATSLSENAAGDPHSLEGCETLPFEPQPLARLDTARAASPSGFHFNLEGNGAALIDPRRRAGSEVKRATLVLPEGMTLNPSVGAGLGVCAPAQFAAETVSSPPGAGCPNASKIGELTVKSPLFEGILEGSLFLAEPDDPATAAPGAENPFDSLLALYLVAKSPERGVLVRLAGKATLDPASGQVSVSFDGLPQLPYANLEVHLRDGQRSALATPASCGAYATRIVLAPWADPATPASFESPLSLAIGPGGGPCPPTATPFHPAAVAGTLNRQAGAYTPYYLHLTRGDEEQEIGSYSAVLPPGLLGKIAGVTYCPEAAIEAAKTESGFTESAHPSCPASSRIGRTVSGYGLGSVLAYATGGLYLAGPWHGSSFSVVAIDSATVGPFDLGVVVVRSAIHVDPRTAQVSIDSGASDPIPHILDGVPIHLRDVRVYIDRSEGTINPTSCNPMQAISTLRGTGQDLADPADDSEASISTPFQVSNCSALGFKPSFAFRLTGGTKRGDFPALHVRVRPRPGDANIGQVAATLPATLFLEQGHIDTVCTRAQFAAGGGGGEQCPAGSVYGWARAVTPLLGVPLEGPVYLRSSGNPVPDLVADLRGQGIEIEVAGQVDSTHERIRGTFDVIPDAPVSEFSMTLNGGKRGLLVDAANVCTEPARVNVRTAGQNNVGVVLHPQLRARCKKAKGHKAKRGRKR